MQNDLLTSFATGGDKYNLKSIPETKSATRGLVDQVDVLYRRSAELHDSVHVNRRDALALDLEERTIERAKNAPRELLGELSDHGFAWRDLARVFGVSVPAINKWRRGEGITGQNRLKIARLLALLDMLRAQFVAEPASWLEMPLRSGVAVTPIDMLASDRYDLVLECAGIHTGPGNTEAILNEFDQDWRSIYVDNEFETFRDNDGIVAIRPKESRR